MSLSASQSFVSVVKAAIGAGSFILPHSMSRVSLSLAVPLTAVLGSLSCYTISLLLYCDYLLLLQSNANIAVKESSYSPIAQSSEIELKAVSADSQSSPETEQQSLDKDICIARESHSYAELAEMLFPECKYHILGKLRNYLSDSVSIGILFTVLGVGAAYIDFISSTLPLIIWNWSSQDDSSSLLSATTTTLLLCPVLLTLSLVEDYNLIAVTSMLGDLSVLAACAMVLIYGIIHFNNEGNSSISSTANAVLDNAHVQIMSNSTANSQQISIKNLFLVKSHNIVHIPAFLGDLTFLFAIHIVAFPILQKTCSASVRPFGNSNVAAYVYTFLSVFNCLFGAIGAMLFQNNQCAVESYVGPCANVLNNLETPGRSGAIAHVVDVVKLMICMDLLFTLPIIISAGVQIIAPLAKSVISSFRSTQQDISSAATTVTTNNNPIQEMSASQIMQYSYLEGDDTSSSSVHDDVSAADVSIREKEASSFMNCLITYARQIFSINKWIRLSTMVIIIMFALLIPNFNDVVSLTGGVICSVTGYVLPPLFFNRLHKIQNTNHTKSNSLFLRRDYLCFTIAGFGIIVMASNILAFFDII